MTTDFLTPRRLGDSDDVTAFDCGNFDINVWIRTRAKSNQLSGASVTMVSTRQDGSIGGFYSLSSYSIVRAQAPGRLQRGMPEPIPAILIGRLAVDTSCQGQGLGVSLLQHAVLKGLEISQSVGIRAIVVHAIDENAAVFYVKFGFAPFEGRPLTLYLLIKDVSKALGS